MKQVRWLFVSAACGLCIAACGDDADGTTPVGGTMAGTMAGTTGGTMAGTMAGTTGGTMAGTMAGTTGGTMAGTTAGMVVAGTEAGTTGGTMAGTTAGTDMLDYVPDSPTWSAIYQQIIVGTGCNGGPLCHGGMVGGLKMSDKQLAYDSLYNVAAMGTNLRDSDKPNCVDSGLVRVVPNDPDASLIIQKMTSTAETVPCGDPMPPNGALDAAQIDQVRMWIMNGAPND